VTLRFAFAAALVSIALATDPVAAQPPIHSVPAVRPLGPATRPYNRAPGSFQRFGVPSYSDYGSTAGLYGPLSYGLGYSPYGYSGLTAGGVGYGPLGYGYVYPRSAPGAMVLPPSSSSLYSLPDRVIPAPAEPQPEPEPLPLPIRPARGGEAASATVVVVVNEGVKVTFEGIANDTAGTEHSFITRPIAPGREVRVMVKVDAPSGPSTFGVRVRAGEKAVVDMRK
jgi:uncharacterized protein (TIGR03000 family)